MTAQRLYDPFRMMVRAGLFFVGPFIALCYSFYPFHSTIAYVSIIVSIFWIYLSIEDVLRLSVPTKGLCIAFILTCGLAVLQRSTLVEYSINFGILTSIICVLLFIQHFKQQSVVGSADFFAIFSLGMTLKMNLLGPWLLITCLIPLIGLSVQKQAWSSKVPFIPYLTIGWMLTFLLN